MSSTFDATLTVVRRLDREGYGLAAVVKRTYSFAGGRMRLADQQVPIVDDPEIAVDDEGNVGPLMEGSDLAAPKLATDVVVIGHAYAPSPAPAFDFGLVVGKSQRVLRAFGERRVELHGGEVSFSAPSAIDRIPLTYELAYGGYDRRAQQLIDPPDERLPWDLAALAGIHDAVEVTNPAPGAGAQASASQASGSQASASQASGAQPKAGREPPPAGLFAYPRNPAGRGYYLDIERERAAGALLPQIEDPADPLRQESFFVPSPLAWIDAPVAASLGWLQHTWFPRFSRFMGPVLQHAPPTKSVREIQLGDADDLRELHTIEPGKVLPRALQGAAPGLACVKLRGDEGVALSNLLRGQSRHQFVLPGERPQVTLRPPQLKAFSPSPTLQTVRLYTDHELLALTWCAIVPLAFPANDDFLAETGLEVEWRRL